MRAESLSTGLCCLRTELPLRRSWEWEPLSIKHFRCPSLPPIPMMRPLLRPHLATVLNLPLNVYGLGAHQKGDKKPLTASVKRSERRRRQVVCSMLSLSLSIA